MCNKYQICLFEFTIEPLINMDYVERQRKGAASKNSIFPFLGIFGSQDIESGTL